MGLVSLYHFDAVKVRCFFCVSVKHRDGCGVRSIGVSWYGKGCSSEISPELSRIYIIYVYIYRISLIISYLYTYTSAAST